MNIVGLVLLSVVT